MTDEKTRAVLEEMRALEKSHRIQSRDGFRPDHAAEADRLKRWGDALSALTVPDGDARERLIDVLVMTDLSDYAGTDMGMINAAADAILAAFPVLSLAAAPEPEWEYRVRTHYVSLESASDSPWMNEETARTILGWEKGDGLQRALFRRRKAGPVLPVGGETE